MLRFTGYRPPSARESMTNTARSIHKMHFLSGVRQSSVQQVSVDMNMSGEITAGFSDRYIIAHIHRFIQTNRNWAAPARKYDPNMANWSQDQDRVDCIREFPAPTPI